MEDNFALYLRSAIYSSNIPGLFDLWQKSLSQGSRGRNTREQITEAVPSIAPVC
jgi:hypothetical protein